jgi:hypothetical protein
MLSRCVSVSCFTRSVCYGVSRACLVLLYCEVLRGAQVIPRLVGILWALNELVNLCPTTVPWMSAFLTMFFCTALHCSENRQQSCMFNTGLCCVQRVFMHPSYVTVPVC